MPQIDCYALRKAQACGRTGDGPHRRHIAAREPVMHRDGVAGDIGGIYLTDPDNASAAHRIIMSEVPFVGYSSGGSGKRKRPKNVATAVIILKRVSYKPVEQHVSRRRRHSGTGCRPWNGPGGSAATSIVNGRRIKVLEVKQTRVRTAVIDRH